VVTTRRSARDTNGLARKTYDRGAGAARSVAVAGNLMYVTGGDSGSDVLVVDVQSGRTIRTLRGVGADAIGLAA